MGIVAGITALGGAAFSAVGQRKAGLAAKSAGYQNAGNLERIGEINAALIEEGTQSNSDIAEFNARMSEMQARDALRRGKESELRFRQGIKGLVGSQKAGYAGQGVDVSVGSAVDVRTDTEYLGNLDALQLRMNSAMESWGFGVQATDYRLQAGAIKRAGVLQAKSVRETSKAEAESARLGGQYAASAGTYGAAASIVGGAGQFASAVYGFKRAG